MAQPGIYDLAVIGGGINGAGVAVDAAGRGLSVALLEQGDLGGATSQASSKLIHGGLRYLEQREFRLVGTALAEREVLLAKAPHIVWPMRFVLPHVGGKHSWLAIRAGLLLYDHLGRRRRLPRSGVLDLSRDPAGRALQPGLANSGFSYWDCWADDARLVILNCRQAADLGAIIRPRTRVSGLRRDGVLWRLDIETAAGRAEISARAVVNAAGPWADAVRALAVPAAVPALRLVQGSHVVVRRLTTTDDAYILQAPDGRVVFALPFERDFTLIGTTEVDYGDAPGVPRVSAAEEQYLLDVANRYFQRQLARRDVIWSFAGVRPLFGDGRGSASSVSRDWKLDLDVTADGAPLLTVFGGKLTTYRKLAEAVLDKLQPHLVARMTASWTAGTELPGGELGGRSFADWFIALQRSKPAFEPAFLAALARRYGSHTETVLGGAMHPADLGLHLGGGLTEREVRYLIEHEWALSADDILWRRTKCGLHMTWRERQDAARWIENQL